MKKIRNNKKGFTLIEMIVVIVIIAILVALAVPAVMGYVQDARNAKLRSAASAGTTTIQAAFAKSESAGTLGSDATGIIEKGKDAAGADSVTICKAGPATGTATCTTPFDPATDSLDNISNFVFVIGDKTVVQPATGGGEATILP